MTDQSLELLRNVATRMNESRESIEADIDFSDIKQLIMQGKAENYA